MKLPGGQEVADADRKAKGWMTFADIVAWSRNVGVSQVAFRLGKTTPRPRPRSTRRGSVRHRPADRHRPRRRGGGHRPRPGRDAVAADRPGQRLVRAGRGRDADPDHAGLLRDGERRPVGHAARRRSQLREPAPSPTTGAQQVISASLSSSLTGLMEHVVTAVPSYNQATYIPGYYVGGKTGTAQIWDPT
jgi:hypothetical protein